MTLRDLPSVDELVNHLSEVITSRARVTSEVRRVLEEARTAIQNGREPGDLASQVRRALAKLAAPSIERVINATGVVLHTNLGRAPLPDLPPARGYSNLEYDLASGRRGKRDAHLAPLLERITGKPAIVVNNNAAAVILAVHELARRGEVIVSRGELIEIGDSFRIPEIMAASGAKLREVGTTNRTNIDDYSAAIGTRTRLLLRVHPSNFRMEGFVARPGLDELAQLAREKGVPLYEDLGSGCAMNLAPFGISEPSIEASFAAGVNLVSFSGDKLLGGPQAGILAGDAALVARLRKSPLYRALRVDKLITQALETTLRHWLFERWDQIPALHMIRMSAAEIRERAERIRARVPGLELAEGRSVAGGGSTPQQTLPTWLLMLPGNAVRNERKLRAGSPPVIGRIEEDRLVLDLRTVFAEEEEDLVKTLYALSK
jgi:L-seryl-tRNA(Ser) seleniumtransferase